MALTATPQVSATHRRIHTLGQVYIEDTLAVDGATELDGNVDMNGTLTVDGAATVTGLLTSSASLAVTGSVTATTSFIIGSADLNETDLEKLDGITNGTVAADKAVVAGTSKHVGTFGQVRGTRFISSEGALTAINTAGPETYTIAQLLTGVIVRDCAGGSRTDTLPTAADLVAGITGCAVGDIIRCYLVNGSDAAETITVDAGAGGAYDAIQIAASRVVPQNSSKMIVIRVTNITGSSEAYVVAM